MWGLLHLVAGFVVLSTFASEVAGVPESVTLTEMGDMPFHVRRTLAEHNFNNMWFGLVVTVGGVLVWRGSRLGVLLCAIVGGLAHLGFTIFMVLPGYGGPIGIAMTFIVAAAIAVSFTAHFGSKSRKEGVAAPRA
jgi:hypothetical protein